MKCSECRHPSENHNGDGCCLDECDCQLPRWFIPETLSMEVAERSNEIYASVLFDILNERQRQNRKWGEQNHQSEIWLAILSEEIGEVSQALLHNKFGGTAAGTLRDELVQVAAVAIQWLEYLDRNGEIIERQSSEEA